MHATRVFPLCLLVFLSLSVQAQNPPHPCNSESYYKNRYLASVSTIENLQKLEKRAESGSVFAQYRLGMVGETRDGKWTAPADHSHQIKWLTIAAKGGNKWAAAELAGYQISVSDKPTISFDDFLRSFISAAEDGDPKSAGWLMYMSKDGPQNVCKIIVYSEKHLCGPTDLVKRADRYKWAEIAAKGGNPEAQDWICRAANSGAPEFGLPVDPSIAAKWCPIAALNFCSGNSISWRWGPDRDFFNPQY